jgi:hypothetical protein
MIVLMSYYSDTKVRLSFGKDQIILQKKLKAARIFTLDSEYNAAKGELMVYNKLKERPAC